MHFELPRFAYAAATLLLLLVSATSAKADACKTLFDEDQKLTYADTVSEVKDIAASVRNVGDLFAADTKEICQRARRLAEHIARGRDRRKKLESTCRRRITQKCNSACWEKQYKEAAKAADKACAPPKAPAEAAPKSKAVQAADIACRNLASAVLMDYTSGPEFAEWLKQCNDHPNPDECQSAIKAIKEYEKPVPKTLTCHGRGKVQAPSIVAPAERVKGPNDDFDQACASIAASVAADITGPFDDWIQKCNQDPNKVMCKYAIEDILSRNKKVPPGLTCRQ